MSIEPVPATTQPPPPSERPAGGHTEPPREPDSEAGPLAPPIIMEAHAAFLADLPEMLRDHDNQWVAYHGKHRIGFGKTKTALWEECNRKGYDDEELLICCVYPYPETDYISAL